MSKKRRFPRQRATNPKQVGSSPQPMRVPVVLDSGDGTPVIAMVTQEDHEALQRRQTESRAEVSNDAR